MVGEKQKLLVLGVMSGFIGQRAVAVVRSLTQEPLEREIAMEGVRRLEGLEKLRIHAEHRCSFVDFEHASNVPAGGGCARLHWPMKPLMTPRTSSFCFSPTTR
ncbi:MAG: hypothetical protein ACKOF3_00120, partial [Spartobacteria bacterium]